MVQSGKRNVDPFLSKPAVSLFGNPTQGLRLPIRETPELPWGDPATWVAPQKFGAQADDDVDDSGALQAAMDSGATTVYLPRGRYAIGKTIVIRGRVQRILGCRAWLTVAAPLKDQSQPVFRLADESAAVLPETIELDGLQTDFASGPFLFLENTSRRTLVMRRLMINFQGARAYEGSGAGTVFIDDVVGRSFRFQGQTVWARQFNVEGDGLHVANDGGTLGILASRFLIARQMRFVATGVPGDFRRTASEIMRTAERGPPASFGIWRCWPSCRWTTLGWRSWCPLLWERMVLCPSPLS